MVLGIFEQNIWPYEKLRLGLEISVDISYQKSAYTVKFVITQLSYINQQKKVNSISHNTKTEGLTKH